MATDISLKERRIQRMSWTTYSEYIKQDPVVFLPVGALEQHGPHLPMGCDAIFAETIALRVAEQIDGLVLPTLTYGYKSQERSGGGQTFPGTTSLDGKTLTGIICDILRELIRHNVTKVVILNGHVENQWFLTEGIDLALRELRGEKNVQILRCEYWNYTPRAVLECVFDGPFPGVDLEHAALIETSMMMALCPDLVDMGALPADVLAEFPAYDHYPQQGVNVPASGVLAPVSGASAAKGHLLTDSTVAALVDTFRTEFGHRSM